jgi:hypothetical protein
VAESPRGFAELEKISVNEDSLTPILG